MWEIIKFFLICVGFCSIVSIMALMYMVYVDDPCIVLDDENRDDWYK